MKESIEAIGWWASGESLPHVQGHLNHKVQLSALLLEGEAVASTEEEKQHWGERHHSSCATN